MGNCRIDHINRINERHAQLRALGTILSVFNYSTLGSPDYTLNWLGALILELSENAETLFDEMIKNPGKEVAQ